MKKTTKNPRGIFLISALFVTVVVTMYLAGAITLIPGGLFQSRNEGFRAQARQAAQSGIDYALARLRANPTWRGDGPSPGNSGGTIVNQPGLSVVEDHGNVIGIIGAGTQDPAQFRLRFNYQDGTPGAEGLDNPSNSDWLDFNLISVNDLPVGIDTMAPQITGSNANVVTNPPSARLVASRSVWLSVQGRAGPGLRSLSLTNMNPSVSDGLTSQVVVQTAYKPGSGSIPGLDAVTMSNAGIDAFLPNGVGNVSISSTLTGQLPNIRSNNGIAISNGNTHANLASPNCAQAHYLSSGPGAFSATTSKVTGIQDPAETAFYRLNWTSVQQAAANAPTMAAGTYVVWQDGSVHYYNMSLAAYTTYMGNPVNALDPGTSANLPPTIQKTPSGTGWNLAVIGDVNVTATTTGLTPTSDLAIIPRSGAALGPGTGSDNGLPTQDALASGLTGGNDYTLSSPTSAVLSYSGEGLYSAVSNGIASAYGNSAMASALGITFNGDVNHFSVGGMTFDMTSSPAPITSSEPLTTALPNFLAQLILANGNMGDISELNRNLNLPTTAPGLIPNSGGDTLTAANLSMTFAPNNSQGFAVISAPANISLGLGLGGAGGSIVSAGNVALTGMGVSLSANPNAQQGVSLYSKGNVTIDTFQQTSTSLNGPVGVFQDLNVKGVVYSWGSVNATLGNSAASTWGNFNLQGALVAYGSDPSLGNPNPATGAGLFSVTAGNASLKFDPSYLQDLSNQYPPNVSMNRVFWNEQ